MKKKIRDIVMDTKFLENAVIAFIIAWLCSTIVMGTFLHAYSLEYCMTQNFPLTLAVLLVLFLAALALCIRKHMLSRVAMLGLVFLCSLAAVMRDSEVWMTMGFCLVILIAFWYVREEVAEFFGLIRLSMTGLKVAYLLLGLFVFAFIGAATVLRYEIYLSQDYDFGLFAQMFEYMKDTGIQYTTVERGSLMSHFKVHVSPIYYLLLPVYMLFPYAATLQLSQAFLVALGLLPLYLLCRHYHLSQKISLAVGICYSLFPALSGSCFYDFHENCFLPVCLLFTIWALEKKKNLWIIVFTILTLGIKEDASLYLLFVGIFFAFSGKDVKRGLVLTVVSGVYFFAAQEFLEHFGLGMLDYYMQNFYYEEGTDEIVQVIKSVIMNPGYAVRQSFAVEGKIEYLFLTLAPLGAAFFTPKKKYARYILMGPYVLLHLMPVYIFIYNIYFQYHFGISALFLYLLVMNLSDWKKENLRYWAVAACMISVLLFSTTTFRQAVRYAKTWVSEGEQFQVLDQSLKTIPQEASVGGSLFLTPHLYKNKELVPIGYGDGEKMYDYLVLDIRPEYRKGTADEFRNEYFAMNYEEVLYEEDLIIIFRKIR